MAIRMWKGRNPDTDTGPEFYDVTFEGAVLGIYERNGYDDSDFFATVWDDDQGAVREVQYATTRGWTYNNSASVDATDEVKAKARAWFEPKFAGFRAARATAEAATPAKGKRVKVVKGRKVPVGTEGTVFWEGEDRYARDYGLGKPRRVGFKDDAGAKWFTAASNVEVIGARVYTAEEFAAEVAASPIDVATANRSLAYSYVAGGVAA